MKKPDLYWVSCHKDTHPGVSRTKHLTKDDPDNGWVRTLCGATGSWGAFHKDASRKRRCAECVEKQGEA